MFTRGFDQGIDFVGGRSYQVRFKNPVETQKVASLLKKSLGSVEVKTFGAANQVRISTKYKYNDESTQTDNEIQEILYKDLQPVMGEQISYEEFMSGEGLGVMKSDKTGPSIAEDIKSSANRMVECLSTPATLAYFLTDTVEDDHCIVQWVTDYGKDSRDKLLVYFKAERHHRVEQREGPQGDNHVVGKGSNGTHGELPFAETC